MPDQKQLRIDVAPEVTEELAELKRRLAVDSEAQVVRYGMDVLKWVMDQHDRGNQVQLGTSTGQREVSFGFLGKRPHETEG